MPIETISLLLLVSLLAFGVAGGVAFAVSARRPQAPDFGEVARLRAEQLLSDVLSEGELSQLSTHGYLDIPSPNYFGRVYRVFRGGGPVQVREDGRACVLLCLQPTTYLPEADVIVMHKLLIEGSERTYLKTANVVGWRFRDGFDRVRV
jgi:hypothetical protein